MSSSQSQSRDTAIGYPSSLNHGRNVAPVDWISMPKLVAIFVEYVA